MNIQNSTKNHNDESDDYLIELIGLKEDFPEEAKDAYVKIYDRYWEPMYIIALLLCCKSREPESDAQDLVSITFERLYQDKAKSFNKSKFSTKNVKASIISWLKTIMKSMYYDYFIDEPTKDYLYTKKKEKKKQQNESLEDSQINPNFLIIKHIEQEHKDLIEQLENNTEEFNKFDNESTEDSHNIKQVSNYINSLSERDADIVLTIYKFYNPGKNTPSEVLDMLENKWGTTRDNIRRIMKNFRDRIKEDLKEKIITRR